jgi:hypothetical protein
MLGGAKFTPVWKFSIDRSRATGTRCPGGKAEIAQNSRAPAATANAAMRGPAPPLRRSDGEEMPFSDTPLSGRDTARSAKAVLDLMPATVVSCQRRLASFRPASPTSLWKPNTTGNAASSGEPTIFGVSVCSASCQRVILSLRSFTAGGP